MSTSVFLSEPPEGVARDVDGRTRVQDRLLIDSSITIVLAIVALGYVMILAMLSSIAFFVCCIYDMKFGLGKHTWNVLKEDHPKYMTVMIPTVITYLWCPVLTKCSLLISFHRLNTGRYFHFIIYLLSSFMVGQTIISTVMVPVRCIKPTAHGMNGKCLYHLTTWHAVISISTNAIVIALPIRALWRMRLPFSQKLGVAVVVFLGSIVTVTSILRIWFIRVYSGRADFMYFHATTFPLAADEINSGILCACLALLKPFILHLFPSLKPSRDSDVPLTPSTGTVRSFSRNRGRSSYQLGYMGHKDIPDDSWTDNDGRLGIVVTNSYHVDEEERNSRNVSMENVIPSSFR
ncbi:hypothetical protein FQN54_005062 [Arachnomyces sp. PD_36]|nr:hypothetical protein FQN54_005062 [Arachnomyces sp. PD_36]